MKKEKLFVYGTLKRGFGLHSYLQGRCRFVGIGTIPGLLYDLGEYPGAFPSSEGKITGEVYELENGPEQLKELDQIEGFRIEQPEDSLFIRSLTDVQLQDQSLIEAWVYFLAQRPNAPRIPGGNYQ